MRENKVVISGYVSFDHIIKIKKPAKIGTTSLVENKTNGQIYFGGCSVNIAAALTKLKIPSIPVIRVGGDYKKHGFDHFLEQQQILLDGISMIEEEATSTCYLIQDPNFDHITIFYPGAMDERYAGDLLDDLFVDSTLGVITVASYADNREFFQKCIANEVPIVFGMKEDSEAFPDHFLRELLVQSKIIFMNQSERNTIEQTLGLNNITDLFDLGKAEIIVTTYGKDGSVFYQKTEQGILSDQIPAFFIEAIIDATGSGDGYISGFLYGYLNGKSIADCCKLGSSLSSFVLLKEGCCTNLPTEERLLKRFSEMGD